MYSLYSTSGGYLSEPESHRPGRMTNSEHRTVEGIGPLTNDGMPLVLRSEVKEGNQHKWYKQMYNSLHKAKDGDDCLTIHYKTRRGRYPFKTSSGYKSEPELNNYNIHQEPVRPAKLDTSVDNLNLKNHVPRNYGSMQNHVRWRCPTYKIQPGRIEDYLPGHSAMSGKENKKRIEQPRYVNNVVEGHLSRALKNADTTTNSHFVIEKKNTFEPTLLTSTEQRRAYRDLQAGGDPPLKGLRLPAPDHSGDEIENTGASTTLAKLDNKNTNIMPQLQQEIICYPITNISKPLDLFGSLPRNIPSYIPSPPPIPIKKSSTTDSFLRTYSTHTKVKRPQSNIYEREKRDSDYSVITVHKKQDQRPPYRSRSTENVKGVASSRPLIHDGGNCYHISKKQSVSRVSSLSPRRILTRATYPRRSSPSSVAFGRSISRERLIAEEKKRLDETIRLCHKKSAAISNILRDTGVKSPEDIKRAVRRSYVKPVVRKRISPTAFEASTNLSISRRKVSGKNKENFDNLNKPKRSNSYEMESSAKKSSFQYLDKNNSTLSLTRTNSTYSLDSTSFDKEDGRKSETKITEQSSVLSKQLKNKKKKLRSKDKPVNNGTARKVCTTLSKSLPSPIKQDTFFQNLFLRNKPVTAPVFAGKEYQFTSFQNDDKYWNCLATKSKAVVRRPSVYLSQKKPVTSSKFLVLENKSMQHEVNNGQDTCNHFWKYNSLSRLSDAESEFDELKPRGVKGATVSFEQRSRSEPRYSSLHQKSSDEYSTKSPERRPASPSVFHPTREIRSPSERRIQSFRECSRSSSSTKERSRSLSWADKNSAKRLIASSGLSNSIGSLNIAGRHGALCRHRHSERFKDLNQFYANLERLGELERVTSSTDLHKHVSQGEIIDYDLWKQYRAHERAKSELKRLEEKLKYDQKEKNFVFRPKDVGDMKWIDYKDAGLRNKDKSVENLREAFETKGSDYKCDEWRRVPDLSSIDAKKLIWQDNSLSDLESQIVSKYNRPGFLPSKDKGKIIDENLCLSKRVLSTLSKDQIHKVKSQLNELYSANSRLTKKMKDGSQKYEFNADVQETLRKNDFDEASSSDKILSSIYKQKENEIDGFHHASIVQENIARISAPKYPTFDDGVKEVTTSVTSEYTEDEKKVLSQSLSRELRNKLFEKKTRTASPTCLARETRGAIAAQNAKESMAEVIPAIETQVKRNSLQEYSLKKEFDSIKSDDKDYELVGFKSYVSNLFKSDDTPTIKRGDSVLKKIKFFEKKREEEPPKIIYHAREYSSPDEEEKVKSCEDTDNFFEENAEGQCLLRHQQLSSSALNFKEMFGEKELAQTDLHPITASYNSETLGRDYKPSKLVRSHSANFESVRRSRSLLTNQPKKYIDLADKHNVNRIKKKFENLNEISSLNFSIPSPLRRIHSNPEVNKYLTRSRQTSPSKVTIKGHETGNVSWLAHRIETKTGTTRGRSRTRRVISPIPRNPLKNDNRFMPHIDIISKTATLKHNIKKDHHSPSLPTQQQIYLGRVDQIRSMLESPCSNSQYCPLYSSNPDVSKFKDISPYLSAKWIAHRYPYPKDNSRSPYRSENESEIEQIKRCQPRRPRSFSPPKSIPAHSQKSKTCCKVSNDLFDRKISRYACNKTCHSSEHKTDTKNKPLAVKFEDALRHYIERDAKNISLEDDINQLDFEKIYEESRRRKYFQEIEDMKSRRHADNFTPSQKSPISLTRYDDFNVIKTPSSPLSSLNDLIEARALYSFQGLTMRELTFSKGDTIYLRRKIDENWYEGEHNGNVGLLPASYVQITNKSNAPHTPKKQSEGLARAKFNFSAQSGIELSLNKGELVSLIRRVDQNWFEGKIANRKGIFPVAYVQVLTDIGHNDSSQTTKHVPFAMKESHSKPTDYKMAALTDAPLTIFSSERNKQAKTYPSPNTTKEALHIDTNSQQIAYRALYKYNPQNNDELELQEGDIIFVLEKCDDGWYVGTSQRTGCFGTFPGNYVERF